MSSQALHFIGGMKLTTNDEKIVLGNEISDLQNQQHLKNSNRQEQAQQNLRQQKQCFCFESVCMTRVYVVQACLSNQASRKSCLPPAIAPLLSCLQAVPATLFPPLVQSLRGFLNRTRKERDITC